MTGVLVKRANGKWQPPATSAYVNEEELKLLLKDVPDLLWNDTAVVDEFWIPGVGSVDLLGVGLDGSITLVECKLRKNPEIRREVVGQVLAYAGGLWRTPYDDFAARYATRAKQPLMDHLRAATRHDIEDEEGLRLAIHSRLQSGTFRLVIAVDHITEELKFVIEWLNGHTYPNVEVLALEAEYCKDGDVEVLVPRFFGETTAKSPPSITKLTEADMVATVDSLKDPAAKAVLQRILAHGHERGHHSAPGTAGMSYWYSVDGKPTSVWAMWPNEKVPSVSVSVGSLSNNSPARAIAFIERLQASSALSPYFIQISPLNMKKTPTVPVPGLLTQEGVLDEFLSAIDEVLLS